MTFEKYDLPDLRGHFGPYGGIFVAETLIPALEELRRVLPRLSARHGLSSREIDDLVDILSIQAELVEPEPVADEALRDDDDQPVLGTLLAGMRAGSLDYLITGDKDLLALANVYPILTPAEFWRRHGGV